MSRPEKIDRRAQAAESLERLHGRLADFATGDEWAAYVADASRFRGYSPLNRLFLQLQWEERREAQAALRLMLAGIAGGFTTPAPPHMGRCAGASWWKARGGRFVKGERALMVFAPIYVTDREAPPNPATGRQPKKYVGCTIKQRTFSSPQVTGVELAAHPTTPLAGDGPAGLWAGLKAFAEGLGIEVLDVMPTTPGASGEMQWATLFPGDGSPRVIRVAPDMAPAQRCKTLAHEIGHALLHDPSSRPADLNDRAAEVEAESVAYVVLSALGVDAGGYSLGYITGWAGGDGKLIARTAERVLRAAGEVLEAVAPEAEIPEVTSTDGVHEAA